MPKWKPYSVTDKLGLIASSKLGESQAIALCENGMPACQQFMGGWVTKRSCMFL